MGEIAWFLLGERAGSTARLPDNESTSGGEMDQDERRDIEIWQAWGTNIALEMVLVALIKSHPRPDALRAAWKDAEDAGFMATSDVDPRVGTKRLALVQDAYVSTLARLRNAME